MSSYDMTLVQLDTSSDNATDMTDTKLANELKEKMKREMYSRKMKKVTDEYTMMAKLVGIGQATDCALSYDCLSSTLPVNKEIAMRAF